MALIDVLTDKLASELNIQAGDRVYVSRGATLTVDVDISCKQIRIGEESTGASPAGQRYGHLVIQANRTITFDGDTNCVNSGIYSYPASADNSSRQSTLQFNDGVVLTNSAGYSNAHRWCIYWKFGFIKHWNGEVTFRNSWNAPLYYNAGQYFDESELRFGDIRIDEGVYSDIIICISRLDKPVHFGRIYSDTQYYSVMQVGGGYWWGNDSSIVTIESIETPDNGPRIYGPAVSAYTHKVRYLLAPSDIRPTRTVPEGLSVSVPNISGCLDLTWTNATAYRDQDNGDPVTDFIVFYNAADDKELAMCKASAGSFRLAGLQDGTQYTIYGKATTDGYHFSDASASVQATPSEGTPPSPPTVSVVSIGTEQVTIGITGVSGKAYLFYKKASEATWSSKDENLSLTADGQLTVTGLVGGVEYEFMAINVYAGKGSDSLSNIVSATPLPTQPSELLGKSLTSTLHGKAIELFRGDTLKLEITVSEVGGGAVDLTASTLRFTVKRRVADADSDAVIAKDFTLKDQSQYTGQAELSLGSGDTELLPGVYVFDVELNYSTLLRKTVARGWFVVKQDVYRRE